MCAGALFCWKMKNSREIWRMSGRNCCNRITLQLGLVLLNNRDSIIDKYQTAWCNMNHLLLADRCRRWLTSVTCVRRRFVMTSFFLVDGCVYRRSFCRVFLWYGHCKYLFVNEQNDANIIGWISFSNCFEWLSLAWQGSLHSLWSLRFLNTTISQGSVAARLRCGGIFNYLLTGTLLISPSVKEFWKSVSIWQI